MKRIFLLMILVSVQSYAQSSGQEMELLMSTPAVTYAQAARFILEASSPETAFNHEEAFLYVKEKGWLPKSAAADDAARLDVVSKIILNAFGIKGGIMYSLTKSPHFAYRELVYMNIIQGRVIASMPVSGEHLLFIIGRLLTEAENREQRAGSR